MTSFLDEYIGRSLDQIRPASFPVFELAQNMHFKDRRKATGEFYLKHLFYTAYLADEMTKSKEYPPDEKKLLIALSLLHDSIELKRKYPDTADYNVDRFYKSLLKFEDYEENRLLKDWDTRDIKKVACMVAIMTPPDKPPTMPLDVWHEVKRQDFYRLEHVTKQDVKKQEGLMDVNDNQPPFTDEEAESMARLIKDVKVAEVLANLRETADDISWARDGMYVKNFRSIKDRFIVFSERVDHFRQLPLDEIHKFQMEEDLSVISNFVGRQ
jgi:hypothetical protein